MDLTHTTGAKNPIPRNDGVTGQGYAQPPGCAKLWGALNTSKCQGMGDGSTANPDLEIIDRIVVPKGTPPGECECAAGTTPARATLG